MAQVCTGQADLLEVGPLQPGFSQISLRQVPPRVQAVCELPHHLPRLIQLRLVVNLRLPQIGPTQIRPGQVGPAQIGFAEICPTQVDVPQHRPAQIDPAEVPPRCTLVSNLAHQPPLLVQFGLIIHLHTAQVGPPQICPTQVGTGQVGPAQHHSTQIGRFQLRSAQASTLQMRPTQVGLRKVHSPQVRPAEVQPGEIPSLRPLCQNLPDQPRSLLDLGLGVQFRPAQPRSIQGRLAQVGTA